MRPFDWQAKLSDYILANRDLPFIWGERDCMLFAAGAYQAMHGVDLAKDFRGYKSEKEALRILRANGGVSGIVDGMLKRKDRFELQTGDIGLMLHETRGEFLAVIYNRYAITPGVERLLMNRTLSCEYGWAC
jgi:hypothetical protein